MKNSCLFQQDATASTIGNTKTLFTSYKALVTLFLLFITLGAWSQAVFEIKSPASIKGFYNIGIGDSTANWGNGVLSKKSITGDLQLGTGVDSLAGTALVNNFSGKIAIIHRGGGFAFTVKALNAQTAGAIAVVIINHGLDANTGLIDSNIVFNPSGLATAQETALNASGLKINIPVIMISLKDGIKLKNALRKEGIGSGYIGGKQVYNYDLKIDPIVAAPLYRTRPKFLAKSGMLNDTLAMTIYNKGLNTVNNIQANVIITKQGGNEIYRDSYNIDFIETTGVDKKDTLFVKFANPFINNVDLETGKYEINYTLVTLDNNQIDEYQLDNTIKVIFEITDSTSSPGNLLSYSSLKSNLNITENYKNEPSWTNTYRQTTGLLRTCSVFQNAAINGYEIAGVNFLAYYNDANTSSDYLLNKSVTLEVFEWNNQNPYSIANLSELNSIYSTDYVFDKKYQHHYGHHKFANRDVLLQNNMKYLVCVSSSDNLMQFGYDASFSNKLTSKINKQYLSQLSENDQFKVYSNYTSAISLDLRKVKSSEKELLSFTLKSPDSTKIEINDVNITIQVSKGTDLTKLVAKFTNSDKAKVTVNEVTQTSGVTVNNFSNKMVEYVVTAEDGSKKTYYVTVNYCTSKYNNIYLSQTAYCPNQEINFSFSGMNSYLIKEKQWNFGNGKYFTQNDPYGSVQTSYSKKGLYTVSVAYINSECFNSLDTTSVQVTISDTLHPNADFYLGKSTLCPNEPFSLNASSYNEVSYTWDMGDKTIYTGTYINHAYKEEWDNSVKLTVTNACGNSSSVSKIIKVSKEGYIDNANAYIYSSEVACVGEPISFSASGIYESILWNFKDNTSNETTKTPSHSFKTARDYLVQARLKDYCGVEKTISKNITIKSSMLFTNIQPMSDHNVCPGENVQLSNNQYYSKIKNYTWILPNNELIYDQSINKTFNEGLTTVYLKLTNYCGNDTMLSTKINVTRNIPISTYNAFNENQPSEFCPNEEFSIRYNSTGIKSYAWTGQGLVNQENGYAGYFKLSKYGEYSMQLKLTSFCGKDTILTKKITIVNNKPIEDQFSYYTFNKSYCPGEEVYFSKMNYDNNYKFEEYNYGDGNQGTSNTHRYDAFGEYTVQLKLTNYCDIDTTIQATVHIAPVSISPSTSIYVSGNNSMQEEIYCQFDEISFGISDYQGASIKSVIWNFGDGTPEVDNSNPTHIFAKSGLLTVKARLTSYCGDTLTIFKKISTRSDVGYKGYINENIPNAVCPGESANFSLNTDFKAVAWDFGDKTQSTAKNAVHSYAKMGTYPITLKLTNNCNVDTILNYSVEVRNDVAPDIDLDVLANVICPGEKIVFFQSNDSRDYQISYDFGDNTKDYTLVDSIAHYSASILSHKYTSKGTYQMKLTAKNKCGLTATSSETITVQDGLKLDVNADIDGENVTEDTLLFVLNTGGSEFTWNFGKNDIVKTDVGFIKHGFSSTGDKNISVFVKTTCGDTGTYHAQVTITKVTTIANVTSCGNYLWKNKVYTQSGTYSNVFTNKQGFDSIVTLQLTIYAPSKSTTVYKAKGSYTWNGVQYTQSGVYTFTTKNVHGCDSVATLELTIESQGTSTISIATCGSYAWNGKKYTQSGSYTYTTKNAQGNDSIATLLLTILPATSSSTNFTANGVYTWNDNTYSTSGVYTFTSKNVNGCDSIATLVLTIVAPGKSTTVVSACDSYTWNGKNYIQSGVYTFSTKTNSGADSTATLLLTISTSSSTSFNHTACGNYVWNGMSYTKSGKYVVTAKNTKGCDSTITLNLSINEVPSVLTGIQNGSLFATQTNATYQWLNCEVNKSAVKDATNQVFLPTQTGSYAVQVTKNGCVDTSSCISFETQSTSGIKDVQEARFTIYPNPNQGVFQIAGLPTGTYKILNLMGAVVFDFTVENLDVQLLNLSHLAKGVYQVASEDIKIMHNKVVITD